MPISWRFPRIFYGWWIVIASFLTAVFMGGAIFYGFTAFFEPIVEEMGWSYTQISFAASLRGLEMGILAPLVGMLIDRWGPRRLVSGGVFITVVGLILLRFTNSLGMFYTAFAFIALGTSASTATVLMTAVANWFRRRIGLASGVAICGFGFSGLLVPVIVRLIEVYEWRPTLTILAIAIFVIVLPLSLVFRNRPEDYGQYPDGESRDVVTQPDDSGITPAAGADIKARQAFRSHAFWFLTVASVYLYMVVSAIVIHVMPYLSSIRVERATASFVAGAIPLASVAGRFFLGWLGDRFERKRVAAVSLAMTGLGVFCFAGAAEVGAGILALFLLLFGIGYGGVIAMRPALGRDYFGRSNFGTIFGLMTGIGGVGGIAGPTLAGWVFDTWGSYQAIWYVLGGLAVIPLALVLRIQPPEAKSFTL